MTYNKYTVVILMQTIKTDHILISGKVYKYFYIYSPYMGNIQQIDPKKVYTRAWSWRYILQVSASSDTFYSFFFPIFF
jgi:hypothetical protein